MSIASKFRTLLVNNDYATRSSLERFTETDTRCCLPSQFSFTNDSWDTTIRWQIRKLTKIGNINTEIINPTNKMIKLPRNKKIEYLQNAILSNIFKCHTKCHVHHMAWRIISSELPQISNVSQFQTLNSENNQ